MRLVGSAFRTWNRSVFVAAVILAMRLIDLFWLIEPEFNKGDLARVNWQGFAMDLLAPIGVSG